MPGKQRRSKGENERAPCLAVDLFTERLSCSEAPVVGCEVFSLIAIEWIHCGLFFFFWLLFVVRGRGCVVVEAVRVSSQGMR